MSRCAATRRWRWCGRCPRRPATWSRPASAGPPTSSCRTSSPSSSAQTSPDRQHQPPYRGSDIDVYIDIRNICCLLPLSYSRFYKYTYYIINGCLNNVFKTGTSKIFLSVGNLYKKALNIQNQSKSPNIMSINVHYM